MCREQVFDWACFGSRGPADVCVPFPSRNSLLFSLLPPRQFLPYYYTSHHPLLAVVCGRFMPRGFRIAGGLWEKAKQSKTTPRLDLDGGVGSDSDGSLTTVEKE